MKVERMVWVVKVKSKHFLTDWFQGVKDTVGMNLTAYEHMIDQAIEEAYVELIKKYPDVKDIKIMTSAAKLGTAEVIVYGFVKREIKKEKRK